MLAVLSLACSGLAAAGLSTRTTVTLGGVANERAKLMEVTVSEPFTPASLAAAQYLAALPEMAHGTRDVLCGDGLCALTLAACGSKVDAFRAPGEDASAQALRQVAEEQRLDVTLKTFDLMAEGEPLPIVGREKRYYGDAGGNSNLLVFTDALPDEPSARRMSVVIADAVKLGAWVILADPEPSPWRSTFLELLEKELFTVDCGYPYFDDAILVEQPELGWEAEEVALLRLNSPMFAAALDTGYDSLLERRGFALPPPTVVTAPVDRT